MLCIVMDHPQSSITIKLIPHKLAHSSTDPVTIIPCLDSTLPLDRSKIIQSADLAFGAVEVDHLDAVVVGVHPVEDALRDVQAESVGPQHRFAGQEHVSVGAVHPSPLDLAPLALLRVLFPVCPVHPPEEAIKELSWVQGLNKMQ